jgi:hypothetical protein
MRDGTLESLLFATEKEAILLAIVVKFCQRNSGAGFKMDKYLRPLATARLPQKGARPS